MCQPINLEDIESLAHYCTKPIGDTKSMGGGFEAAVAPCSAPTFTLAVAILVAREFGRV